MYSKDLCNKRGLVSFPQIHQDVINPQNSFLDAGDNFLGHRRSNNLGFNFRKSSISQSLHNRVLVGRFSGWLLASSFLAKSSTSSWSMAPTWNQHEPGILEHRAMTSMGQICWRYKGLKLFHLEVRILKFSILVPLHHFLQDVSLDVPSHVLKTAVVKTN